MMYDPLITPMSIHRDSNPVQRTNQLVGLMLPFLQKTFSGSGNHKIYLTSKYRKSIQQIYLKLADVHRWYFLHKSK